jgi:putative addiction module killer protein
MPTMDVMQYQTVDGVSPFAERLAGIRDSRAQARIVAAVVKMQSGLFGYWRSLERGVYEAKIDYGPGYRIYYGKDGEALVILLLCGDKRAQDKDIEVARDYWKDYKSRK